MFEDVCGELFASVPALVEFDLSRNEPGHRSPRALGGAILMSAFAMKLAHHPRLAVLHLPSLKSEAAVNTIERLLASLPAVREVTVWGPSHRMPTSSAWRERRSA